MMIVSGSPLDYNGLNYDPKGAIFMSFFELDGMKLFYELRGNPVSLNQSVGTKKTDSER